MSEEDKIKIGSHIKITPGFPFNSSHFNTDGVGLPLIRIRDLLQSKIETYFKGEYTKEFLIEKDDILIGMDGDFHIVKWKNERAALLNQRIMKVEQKKEALIDINYFYYFLFPFLKDVWDKTTATTVKHLSTYDVSEAYEKFPTLSEQSKIAQILSANDAVIEKTQAAIDKYKAIKQGMLHDLFTRGIDISTGKLRPKYEDAPDLYKESKLGMIPKEWEEKTIEEIGDVVTGSTPSTAISEYYGNEFLFVSPADIKQNLYILNTEKKLTQSGFDTCRKLTANTICVVCIGSTIGKIALLKTFGCTNQQINSVICFDPDLSFFYYYAMTHYNEQQFGKETGLQAVPIVNKSSFSKFALPKATKDEATEISKRLLSIDDKLQAEQNYLLKIQKIKSGLMSDLLSGKKRVIVNEGA